MSKYTKGPWTVVPKPRGTFGKDWIEIHGAERGAWVVMPGSFEVNRGEEHWTENGVRIQPEDARLIAAAPDLFEALQAIVKESEAIPGAYLYSTAAAIARAAIQKAEPIDPAALAASCARPDARMRAAGILKAAPE